MGLELIFKQCTVFQYNADTAVVADIRCRTTRMIYFRENSIVYFGVFVVGLILRKRTLMYDNTRKVNAKNIKFYSPKIILLIF